MRGRELRNRLHARLNPARASAVLAAAAFLGVTSFAAPATAGPAPDSRAPHIALTRCGHGISAVTITPAPGFDPLTATFAQLEANGLPPRPRGGTDLAIWKRFVTSGTRHSAGCNFTIMKGRRSHLPGLRPAPGAPGRPAPDIAAPDRAAPDITTGQVSPIWAGNVADSHTYDDIYGTWHVPAATGPVLQTASSLSWIGIGQGASSTYPLIQGGSESDFSLHPAYYLWWEYIWAGGGVSQIRVKTLTGPGDYIGVHVHVVNGVGQVTISDPAANFNSTYQYSRSTLKPDTSAEWIYERPEQKGLGFDVYTVLAKASTTFTLARASGAAVPLTALGNLPHHWVTMRTCTSPGPVIALANPAGISADGLSFTDVWLAGGHEDPVNCH